MPEPRSNPIARILAVVNQPHLRRVRLELTTHLRRRGLEMADDAGPLISIAKDSGVRRFIYASSSSVYGVKAVANDMALRVTDIGMRVCGGAAFSEHLRVESVRDGKVWCQEYVRQPDGPDAGAQ